MKQPRVPSEDQFKQCAAKHFIDPERYVESLYTPEQILSFSAREIWRKVCRTDVGGLCCRSMKEAGVWDWHRKKNTLCLFEYEDMCDHLKTIPPRFKILLPDRPQYLILVGPVPSFTIHRFWVVDEPSDALTQPFSIHADHLKWKGCFPDDEGLKKKLKIGEGSLMQNVYTYSARISQPVRDLYFRTEPLSLNFTMFLCDENKRPFHMQFTVSDPDFVPRQCEENLTILSKSSKFCDELRKLKSEYGVFVHFSDGKLEIVSI